MPLRVSKTTWAFSCHCRQWITTAVNGSLLVVYKTRRKKKFTFRTVGSFIQNPRRVGRKGEKFIATVEIRLIVDRPFPFSIVTAMLHTANACTVQSISGCVFIVVEKNISWIKYGSRILAARARARFLVKKRNGNQISHFEKTYPWMQEERFNFLLATRQVY